MELIAASRIVKAQQRVDGVHAVRRGDHPRALGGGVATPTSTTRCSTSSENRDARRGAAHHQRPRAGRRLLLQRDPGGRAARRAAARARARRSCRYVVGRKGVGYYRFRDREMAASGPASPSSPTYADAKEIADALIEAFLHADRRGRRRRDPHRLHRVRQHGHPEGRGPAAAAAGGRGDRGGAGGRRAARCTSSSRPPRRVLDALLPQLRREPRSTPRCSSRRPPSTRPAGGR